MSISTTNAADSDDLPPAMNGYTFKYHLGSAQTHDTFLAREDVSQNLYVVRAYSLGYLRQNEQIRQIVEREALMASIVQHPNITKFGGSFITKTDLFTIEKYYSQGELYRSIEVLSNGVEARPKVSYPPFSSLSNSTIIERDENLKNRQGLSIKTCKRILRELMLALRHLHENCGVAHRNLKLENIFLDREGHAIISGLGLCAVLPRKAPASLSPRKFNYKSKGVDIMREPPLPLRFCFGSKHYVAPELIEGHPYDGAAVDVWAAGVILFVMCTGCFPFDSESDKDEAVFKKIRDGDYTLSSHEGFKSIEEPLLQDILRNMLRFNPKARFSVDEVIEHPFLTN
ncbi:unnamed protein product [Phytomonas sp. Hart1]|nr:unnamed protein product [Phytomonas sp. Hart1]|eukprot:CCW71836.1 unnamed protein product [Phytomonas sp. isolate Hart1]